MVLDRQWFTAASGSELVCALARFVLSFELQIILSFYC